MKKVKILIVVSLLLNMILAGALLGMCFREQDRSPVTVLKMWGKNELPDEKRQEFDAMMRDLEARSKNVREQVFEARQDMMQKLSAEPYNKGAYLASVTKFQRLMKAQMWQFANAVADYAKTLSPEERASLAKMLNKRPGQEKKAPPIVEPAKKPEAK